MSRIFPGRVACDPAAEATASPSVVPSTPAATAPSASAVDAVLSGMAAKGTEKLNWRTSIVDLMKVLGLDSSLAARKELAMNVWLQKQVLRKFTENGGKLPAEMLA